MRRKISGQVTTKEFEEVCQSVAVREEGHSFIVLEVYAMEDEAGPKFVIILDSVQSNDTPLINDWIDCEGLPADKTWKVRRRARAVPEGYQVF
ncbi:MAG: hypothetical protein ACYC9Q_09335 [Bacillota bacterium]